MGLDTTHDAWHGAYSAFMRWRTAIAKAAGIPLILMDGFHRCPPDWIESVAIEKRRRQDPENRGPMSDALTHWACEVDDALPVRWESLRPDPLHVLLSHSDCDGEIAVEHLEPIAARLEELLPELDKLGDGGGHVGFFGDKTRAFIAGLRRAAAANEPLGFH